MTDQAFLNIACAIFAIAMSAYVILFGPNTKQNAAAERPPVERHLSKDDLSKYKIDPEPETVDGDLKKAQQRVTNIEKELKSISKEQDALAAEVRKELEKEKGQRGDEAIN